MGLVEQAFDADGRYYEGRADMSIQLDVSLKSTLDLQSSHHHTLLAWTCLRARHVLLQAKAPKGYFNVSEASQFMIDVPTSLFEAVEEARSHVVFLDKFYSSVEPLSFYNSAQCCTRLVDPDRALARLFVLPQDQAADGSHKVSYLLVAAHQIGDGIAMSSWVADFVRLLNMPDVAINTEIATAIRPECTRAKLPLPQEALYPAITGSRARQRWFWLLTRILRHVRKPLPAGFANPLLKEKESVATKGIAPAYGKVLDFTRSPPNDTVSCRASASRESALRLTKICRKANVSVGAGCFALAAVLMMELYEQQEKDISLAERRPFITGFPLNPRPFLKGNPAADSLMLAFSDGIMLPFLPSSLDLDGRLRLLAKQAQRQLAIYQKRIQPTACEADIADMGARGAGRMLAIQYVGSIERSASLIPGMAQDKLGPQGVYPMRPNATRQTCGVSSTGRGVPLASMTKYDNPDLVAVPTGMFAGVRAREGEFLIGIGGADAGLNANVSVDISSMDSKLVAQWQQRFAAILEEGQGSASSRL